MTKTAESAAPVRSVRRALAILRAFRLSDRSLALGEIARRARLDKATARRLLMTLMAERLVEQDADTKGYSLGLGVLELAAGLTPCDDLRQRAQPVLAAIAENTGATVFLGVVHDGAALCIGRVDGGEAIQIRAWSVGGRMPLNCGAGPRVLMAYRPAAELARILARPLEALTPFTPADAADLSATLARIRQRGWELGVNDVVEGISSVGLPVHDRSGTVIAAISISGLHVHILADDRPRHLSILQSKVRELEQRL
jgi:DNA-binding IclR family transcriptional regulator